MRRKIALLLLLASPCLAGELVIDRRAQWREWNIPGGVLDLRADGSLRMVRFAGKHDPMLNMGDFEHETRESGTVRGGIRVKSDVGSVGALLDRDESTWWQPDPADGLDNWAVTIDLGRLELVESLRLVFPDTLEVRPMRHFTVFVSEGMPIWDGRDLINYRQVYTTILGNNSRVIDIHLSTKDPIGGISQATGDNLTMTDSLAFRPVQYIRVVPRELTEGAAIAEIEAVSRGENIALGTFGRGGSIRSSKKFQRTSVNIFDGTVEKFWLAAAAKAAEREWKVGGQYFEWDLGVAFWLDEIVAYSWPPRDLGQTDFLAGSGPIGYEIELSDGTPISFGPSEERFRGPYDYERLTLVDNQADPRRWIFQHTFEARKTRYIFYHHFNWGRPWGWGFKFWEIFLYAPGHPAEVTIQSDMISLGGVRNLESISWDAELPAGTDIEVRTKSGDQIGERTLFHDRNGAEVTETRFRSLKTFQRGDTLNVPFEGDDWSQWSEPYKISGESFRSPSPREYIRFRVSLITQDPEQTPIMNSLTLGFDDPLFRSAIQAEVLPREGPVGEWQVYTYTIRSPVFRSGDDGYDGLLLSLGAPVRDVSVRIGTEADEEATWEVMGDTLRIRLSRSILRDPVEVDFSARLLRNPTVINALLTNSEHPGITQGVKPATEVGNDALTVFLPAVSGGADLIVNVSTGTGTVTPNGDGVNDELILTFDLLKVNVAPQVLIFDLAGRLIRTLTGSVAVQQEVRWDGQDGDGNLVAPGVYLCRIEVEAGVGTRSQTQIVHVAY